MSYYLCKVQVGPPRIHLDAQVKWGDWGVVPVQYRSLGLYFIPLPRGSFF